LCLGVGSMPVCIDLRLEHQTQLPLRKRGTQFMSRHQMTFGAQLRRLGEQQRMTITCAARTPQYPLAAGRAGIAIARHQHGVSACQSSYFFPFSDDQPPHAMWWTVQSPQQAKALKRSQQRQVVADLEHPAGQQRQGHPARVEQGAG